MGWRSEVHVEARCAACQRTIRFRPDDQLPGVLGLVAPCACGCRWRLIGGRTEYLGRTTLPEVVIDLRDPPAEHRTAVLRREERRALRRRALLAWRDAKSLLDTAVLPSRTMVARIDRVVEMGDDIIDEGHDDSCPRALLGISDGWLARRVDQHVRSLDCSVIQTRDGATAVGLAMVSQPDLAVVDTALAPLPGMEVAGCLRIYAPRTRLLVITSSPELDDEAQHLGFATMASALPEFELTAVLEALIA